MNGDPYDVLKVSRDASQAEIKKAYRRLAKELHPDLSPGDKSKEAAFQKVGAAYDILGDPEKRRRFDAGEIDASGQERPERQFYRHYAGAQPGDRYRSSAGFQDFEDVSDVFADLFGRRSDPGGRSFSVRGGDLHYRLEVDFLDAVRGATRTVPLPDGQTVDLKIPAGVRDGQTLRLRGKGRPGIGQGDAGDALIEIAVAPHPVFAREGDDIVVEIPVTFDEAVLGASIEVPTIAGPVSLRVPEGTSSGRRLRLRGKGVRAVGRKAGDQIVRIRIVLPERIDEDMKDIARRWRERAAHDPRRNLETAK